MLWPRLRWWCGRKSETYDSACRLTADSRPTPVAYRRPCLPPSLKPTSVAVTSTPASPFCPPVHTSLSSPNNPHSMSSGISLSSAAADKMAEAEATLPNPISSSPSVSLPWWRAHRDLRDFLMSEVDPELSMVPLTAYCFMTGWMCAIVTSLLSFLRDRLVPYRTVTQYRSPPYSSGARFKLAIVCRCIVFRLPHARRLLT